jgi:hypothetical protein
MVMDNLDACQAGALGDGVGIVGHRDDGAVGPCDRRGRKKIYSDLDSDSCRHSEPADQCIRPKQAVLAGSFKSRNDLAQDFGEHARLSSWQKSDKSKATVRRSSGVIRLARSTFSFSSRSLSLLGRRWEPPGVVGCRGFIPASIHRSFAREQQRTSSPHYS